MPASEQQADPLARSATCNIYNKQFFNIFIISSRIDFHMLSLDRAPLSGSTVLIILAQFWFHLGPPNSLFLVYFRTPEEVRPQDRLKPLLAFLGRVLTEFDEFRRGARRLGADSGGRGFGEAKLKFGREGTAIAVNRASCPPKNLFGVRQQRS